MNNRINPCESRLFLSETKASKATFWIFKWSSTMNCDCYNTNYIIRPHSWISFVHPSARPSTLTTHKWKCCSSLLCLEIIHKLVLRQTFWNMSHTLGCVRNIFLYAVQIWDNAPENQDAIPSWALQPLGNSCYDGSIYACKVAPYKLPSLEHFNL